MPSRALIPLVAVALFLGSALLFVLEPMFGRRCCRCWAARPQAGRRACCSSSSRCCVGYLYAWASHDGCAPPAADGSRGAASAADPGRVADWGVIRHGPRLRQSRLPSPGCSGCSRCDGLPFLAVATTSPVLQHWFSEADHPDAVDPYFLYQASNLGQHRGAAGRTPSLSSPGSASARSRRLGMGLRGVPPLVGVCALTAHGVAGTASRRRHRATAARTPRRRGGGRRAGWRSRPCRRACCSASRATSRLTSRPVPLLWVIPLVLYLLTFVLAFARRADHPARLPCCSRCRWSCCRR